ncbi:Hypothetical predicted protein, partial [Pelobates cultripes]
MTVGCRNIQTHEWRPEQTFGITHELRPEPTSECLYQRGPPGIRDHPTITMTGHGRLVTGATNHYMKDCQLNTDHAQEITPQHHLGLPDQPGLSVW